MGSCLPGAPSAVQTGHCVMWGGGTKQERPTSSHPDKLCPELLRQAPGSRHSGGVMEAHRPRQGHQVAPVTGPGMCLGRGFLCETPPFFSSGKGQNGCRSQVCSVALKSAKGFSEIPVNLPLCHKHSHTQTRSLYHHCVYSLGAVMIWELKRKSKRPSLWVPAAPGTHTPESHAA